MFLCAITVSLFGATVNMEFARLFKFMQYAKAKIKKPAGGAETIRWE